MKSVLLLVALALPLPCLAQMYKCVDERGVTHYSDKPRPGCKSAPVEIRASPPLGASAARPERDPSQQEADFQRRRIERERNEEKATAQRAALERRCAAMHTELQRLAAARSLATVNAKGERTEVSDEQRNARAASLKAEIARQCP